MPVSRDVFGSQPRRSRIMVLSLLRPRTPCGRDEVVAALELDAGDLLDDVDELVDRHELASCRG